MAYFENIERPERALLVSVDTGDFDAQASIDELEELAHTAGAEVLAKMVQKRAAPDAATFIGSGRIAELRDFCQQNEADLLIFDGELTPSQQRNIEKLTDVRVVDRTTLILDIFAARARSSEGKLQVELAQLKYTLPRLGGKGTELSRLGGGIGTRGPGESKLENDRRHIRRRITALEKQLEAVERRRVRLRERRQKTGVETVAIVGYTNAGKSTLMNALTNAGVLAEDKLFATLDPTARALTLPDGRTVMLVDTVGLVRRLPHQLVEAFKSTLEEAASADLILNVCDASSPECAEHLEVTKNLLDDLGCAGKPVVSVMNKCDLAGDVYALPAIGRTVMISALLGRGLEQLLHTITDALPASRRRVKLLLPFDMGSFAARLRKEGVIHAEEYRESGIYLEATAELYLIDLVKQYILE
ncbi:MAG TPA: GTPase HflX [Candidatus Fimivicinus intestinavium]|nr:GTPase HflX [Candidatus Fimivicinus intestinavium]